ncbi:MAG: glucosaminidase domain-containing protein, partial [Phaeodactylibacter sp.]|nr:glucosaminidase domain-containing protein [Phaeodactylibacter sp.]
KCRGCTCRNYTDDDIYDMFRVFESPGESFREHSILLSSSRYKHLLKLRKTDYRKWAHGLKKAGYATDKRYAEKLIRIIEFFDLGQYDRSA